MAASAKAIRTRSALLVALQELMLDAGGAAVSVPRLVAHVGISQGTFYNYFDSLPAAIDAVGAMLFGEHLRTLAVVIAGVTDPARVIARTTRQTLLLMAHRPDVGRLLFDSGLPPERLLLGFRAHLRGDLESALQHRVSTERDVDAATAVLAGALQGACLDMHRGRLAVEAISATIACTLRALGIEEATVRRLADEQQDFVPWRPLPLIPTDIAR